MNTAPYLRTVITHTMRWVRPLTGAASARTHLRSTARVASREVRRGLLRAGLARFQLCHLAFEPPQSAVENVCLSGLHRLVEPAQEAQEPRPAALWARAVRRVAHESSIRTARLSRFVGWTAFDHASSAASQFPA